MVLWASWLALAALVAWLVRLRTTADVDLWLHLRIGDELRAGTRFDVLPDPLAVLADRPYVPTQWLAEVGMSGVHEVAGVLGIHLVRALLLLALAGTVHATVRPWRGPLASVAVTAAVLFGTSAAWAERPQLLGLVAAAVAVLLWSRTLQDSRPRWVLVPLTWCWSTAHGSWPVGVAVGGVVLVALLLRRPRAEAPWARLVALLVASALVPALTPVGPRLLLEPFAVGVAARGHVSEWQAPSPGNPLLVLVVLLGALVAVRMLRAHHLDPAAVLFALAGVGLAATSVRTIALGALLLAPALARAGGTTTSSPVRPREVLAAVVAGTVLLLVPGVVIGGPHDGPLPPSVDAAVDRLPPGTVVSVDARASGWVLWAHPGVRVLRDLRAEVYTAPTAEAHEDFVAARPGWQAYADTHRVAAVLTRGGEPLDQALTGDAVWTRQVGAGEWVLWERTG